MKFLYFYRVPVPDPRADAIQIVNTCAGIARAGGDVDLHVEKITAPSTVECLRFYGIDLAAGGSAGRLDLVALGRHWSWPVFDLKLRGILKRAAGGVCSVFLREVRPYVPGLIARAREAGMPVIFEAHNVSAALIEERRQRALGAEAAASGTAGGAAGVAADATSGAAGGTAAGGAAPGSDTHRKAATSEAATASGAADGMAADGAPAVASANTARALRRKASERADLERRILGAIDGLICTQRATLEALMPLLPPGLPTMILGNGTQIPPDHPAATAASKDLGILYCGSLKAWKGVDTLVAAMQYLGEHRLTIVGPHQDSDRARVLEAARSAGAEARVTILPAVKPADVFGLYARARVGVIPLAGGEFVEARDFTSPLKLFEMMAAGLPIVASSLPSIREYVEDGGEAVLVPPDDPRALAEGIGRVLSDAALARGLIAAARARISGRTWDDRGREVLAFAEKVLRMRSVTR